MDGVYGIRGGLTNMTEYRKSETYGKCGKFVSYVPLDWESVKLLKIPRG